MARRRRWRRIRTSSTSTSAWTWSAARVLEIAGLQAGYGDVRALFGVTLSVVAVGRALRAGPRLLMLDEPSLGLAPRLVAAILEALVAINRAGVAVFLVEQNVPAALSLAHRGYLLEGGRIVGEGSGASLMADEHVRRAYLGPLAVRTPSPRGGHQ